MLLTSQRLGEAEVKQSVQTEDDEVEVLRQILAEQGKREVGYSEAQEIGASLIEFYQILAEEVCDDSES